MNLLTKIHSKTLKAVNISKLSPINSGIFVAEQSTKAPESNQHLAHRLKLWNILKEKYDNSVKKSTIAKIKVNFKDGPSVEATSWLDTPYKILSVVDKKIADSAIVATVNGIAWDLNRPLEDDSSLEIFTFRDLMGKQVFWNSSAHVLGAALEQKYGGLLWQGPATGDGFYHDTFIENKAVLYKIIKPEKDTL